MERTFSLSRCLFITSLALGASLGFAQQNQQKPAKEKYQEATPEEKEKIKADFVTNGVLPPGCNLWADAIVCSGPQGDAPPPVRYNLSTPRAPTGTLKSAMQSITGSNQIEVSSEEMKTAWKKWYEKEPDRARAWINRRPHVIRDFNRDKIPSH